MPYRATVRISARRPVIAVEADPSDLAAVAGALGAALPDCPGSAPSAGSVLHRFGPGSLMWVGAPGGGGPDLVALEAVPATGARIVADVSDAYGWLELSGDDALAVLAQGVALDLRARAFPPGAAARTLAFGVEVILCRTAAGGFDIGCRASCGDALAARLRLAADPAGEAA